MATIHDFARMCNYHEEQCEGCPFTNLEDCYECGNYLADFPDKAMETIDKWIATHPIKTYASNFYDKFPNATKNSEGYPNVCIEDVYGDDSCLCDKTQNIYGDCCKKCWNREYKGE